MSDCDYRSTIRDHPCYCGGPPHKGDCHFGWHKPDCPESQGTDPVSDDPATLTLSREDGRA